MDKMHPYVSANASDPDIVQTTAEAQVSTVEILTWACKALAKLLSAARCAVIGAH